MRVRLVDAKGAYNGLGAKVGFARRVWGESLLHPEVREFAENAAGPGNREAQARRLFYSIRETVHYFKDTAGIELTKAPWVLIEEVRRRGYAAGDCDDQAVLSYVLLKSLGIQALLRVGWYGKEQPQHIYALAVIGQKRIPFDTTLSRFGEEVRYVRALDFK